MRANLFGTRISRFLAVPLAALLIALGLTVAVTSPAKADWSTSSVSLAVSPDGTKAYSADGSNDAVRVINTATGSVITSWTGLTSPYGIALSPDGTKAYVTTGNGGSSFVKVFNTSNGTVADTWSGFSLASAITLNAAGTRAYVANLSNDKVTVVNTSNGNTVTTWSGFSSPTGIAVDSTASVAYVANGSYPGSVSVVNMTNGTITATWNGFSIPKNMALSSDGSQLYVANATSNSVSVIDTSNGGLIESWSFPASVWGVALSRPTATVAYVSSPYPGDTVYLKTLLQQPTVTAISPAAGPTDGSQTVTLTGTDFVAGATVSIGGVACTSVNVVSTTSLSCTTGTNTAGAKAVSVTTGGGTSPNYNGYTYRAAPTVTAVSPPAGPVGGSQSVTLTGTNFVNGSAPDDTTVSIGGVACTSVNVTSTTSLTCDTGANTAGLNDVTVTTAGGTSSPYSGYLYRDAPTVTEINPVLGPADGGTTVTIKGTNFVNSSAPDDTTISIGGVNCGSVSVASTSELTCVTGSSSTAVYNSADVTVTTKGGTSSPLSGAFTYYERPGTVPAPVVAVTGYGEVTVTVQSPTSGGPASSYVVRALVDGTPTGDRCNVDDPGTSMTCSMSLDPEKAYTFETQATGPGGTQTGVASEEVIPGPPSTPTVPTVTVTARGVLVVDIDPTTDAGPVSAYEVVLLDESGNPLDPNASCTISADTDPLQCVFGQGIPTGGLDPDIAYRVQVVAKGPGQNPAGPPTSEATDPIQAGNPPAPGAPTPDVTGSGKIFVHINPGTGYGPVTSYTIEALDDSGNPLNPATQCVVLPTDDPLGCEFTGLDTTKVYRFVTTVTGPGEDPSAPPINSENSSALNPGGPAAPLAPTPAVTGSGEFMITVNPGSGGGPVTRFIVEALDVDGNPLSPAKTCEVLVTANPLRCAIAGLTDTDRYRFRATAQGPGGPDSTGTAMTEPLMAGHPSTPGAPKADVTGPGKAKIRVIPGDDGGPVTKYIVEAKGEDGSSLVPPKTCEVLADANPLECTIEGLDPTKKYRFDVASQGPGGSPTIAEAPSDPVQPGAPDPVSQPQVTVIGKGKIKITVPPVSTGGPINEYIVVANPGGSSCSFSAPATSCIIGGLDPHIAYDLTVVVRGPGGDSPVSQSTPKMKPLGWTQTPAKNCVTSPRNGIPVRGVVRLLKPGCTTNASRAVRVAAKLIGHSTSVRGDIRLFRVFTPRSGPNRGYTMLQTYGHPRLRFAITWTARATPSYEAYVVVRKYTVRRNAR